MKVGITRLIMAAAIAAIAVGGGQIAWRRDVLRLPALLRTSPPVGGRLV